MSILTPTAVAPPRSRAYGDGARAMLPLLIGAAPFGVVIGATVAGSGMSVWPGWSTGWLVYGGSAQLALLGGLADRSSVWLLLLGVLLINARLTLYTAALAEHWRAERRWWRILAAWLVVDPAFVIGARGYASGRGTRAANAFYLGGAVVLWIGWQLCIVGGIVVGTALPASWPVGSIAPLYLISLIATDPDAVRQRRPLAIAAVVTALFSVVPGHVAAAAGIATGLAAGSIRRAASPKGRS
ncbi:MAG: AzlC family ABC transporter permease [bacterium]